MSIVEDGAVTDDIVEDGQDCAGNTLRRIRLTVAYDGTNYHGWQIQNNGITVEGELRRCLRELLQEEIEIIGASRTDAGVHALGNVAVFDTATRMPADKISYALNRRLPEDIRIQCSDEVAPDWHPRRQECRKTYEYRVCRGEFPVPTKRLYTLFTYRKLDVERMKAAAEYLVGEHDFKSFCQMNTPVKTTRRTIYSLTVEEDGAEVIFRVCGNGFLYNMVRIIVGTLLEVGEGKRAPEEMAVIVAKKDRVSAGPTAPAHGLTLIGYEWTERLKEHDR